LTLRVLPAEKEGSIQSVLSEIVIREVHKPLRVQAQEVLDRLKNARLLKSWPELQMRIMQLARGGSPPPGLGPPQAELSRNSNQVAFARIRRFESDMPSQAVGLQQPTRRARLPARSLSAAS
jgi:hypothetical protein